MRVRSGTSLGVPERPLDVGYNLSCFYIRLTRLERLAGDKHSLGLYVNDEKSLVTLTAVLDAARDPLLDRRHLGQVPPESGQGYLPQVAAAGRRHCHVHCLKVRGDVRPGNW